MIPRMTIARQFLLLGLLCVALTVAGVGLSLTRARNLAFEAKRTEIKNEAEEGASIILRYVQREQSGEMTRAQAQKQAFEAVDAIRFAGVNYVALADFDGIALVNGNKEIVGKNISGFKDTDGVLFVQKQIEQAKSGVPGFVEYHWKKIGETSPKLKMAYVIGIPEWQIVVATGDFADDIDTALVTSIVHFCIIFVPLLLSFLTIVLVMCRNLSKALGSLSDGMRRLATGDLTSEIDRVKRQDELGQMAEALVGFRLAAIEKTRLEAEAADMRQIMAEEQRSREEDRAAAAATQAAVLEALASGLDKLSDGDLTFRLAAPFSSGYEKLRADFNGAVAKLEDTLQAVASNTQSLHAGSGEIATAADDLSRRTEQQAASLEQTAAALDEITATVRKTADSANHAHQVASTTKTVAEGSGGVVQQATKAMGLIEQSSGQISQIIGVIDEIAFQTNLLALNAGVEAARAGDSGRGFAVVASEVRALAQRSAQAAKEINSLIAVSAGHVASGAKLVDETGCALGRIVTQVAELNSVIADITASASQQATALAEVNTAVNQMDQVTQQNAAMVEQTTAASHSLAHETEQLSGLVGRFKIGTAIRTPIAAGARYAIAGRDN